MTRVHSTCIVALIMALGLSIGVMAAEWPVDKAGPKHIGVTFRVETYAELEIPRNVYLTLEFEEPPGDIGTVTILSYDRVPYPEN